MQTLNDTVRRLIVAQTATFEQMQAALEASMQVRRTGEKLRSLMEGVMCLTQHKLSDKLVDQEAMYMTLRRLRTQLLEKHLEMSLPSMNDIYKMPASYIAFVNNTTIRGIVHIPLTRVGAKIRLYRYVPSPVMVENRHIMMPSPTKHFLAIADDGSLYKEMTQEDISFCHHIGDRYNCDESGFSLRTRSESCLMALYDKDSRSIIDSCPFTASTEKDRLVQLGPNEVLLYQSAGQQSGTVYVSCPMKSDTVDFIGLRRISVPAGCYMKSRTFYFDGASSLISTPIAVKLTEFPTLDVFKTPFNNSEWVTSMLHSLDKVGDPHGLKIRDIQAMYAQERHNLYISYSWSVFGGVVVFCIVILCACRARHIRKRMVEKANALRDLYLESLRASPSRAPAHPPRPIIRPQSRDRDAQGFEEVPLTDDGGDELAVEVEAPPPQYAAPATRRLSRISLRNDE